MTKSTKIMVVATIIVICVLCLTACNSAEKTADTDKPFDERVIEVALDELDKTLYSYESQLGVEHLLVSCARVGAQTEAR